MPVSSAGEAPPPSPSDDGGISQSTHFQHWLFPAAELTRKRTEANGKALARIASGLTLAEEAAVLRYYMDQMYVICEKLRFPFNISGTALVLFARYFVRNTVMDITPERLVPTFVYLATKIEEDYVDPVNIAKVCKPRPEGMPPKKYDKHVRRDARRFVALEVPALEGVDFHLKVYHPMRPLKALLPALSKVDGVTAEAIGRLGNRAMDMFPDLMRTDAPLSYPPAQIAAAALIAANREEKVTSEADVMKIIAGVGRAPPATDVLSRRVNAVLALLDARRESPPPSADDIRPLLLKLKKCANPIFDPSSKEYKAREEKARREKEAQRALKRKRQREEAAARDRELLGGGDADGNDDGVFVIRSANLKRFKPTERKPPPPPGS